MCVLNISSECDSYFLVGAYTKGAGRKKPLGHSSLKIITNFFFSTIIILLIQEGVLKVTNMCRISIL